MHDRKDKIYCCGDEHPKKRSIVADSNTVVEIFTMVIHSFNTTPTAPTMITRISDRVQALFAVSCPKRVLSSVLRS